MGKNREEQFAALQLVSLPGLEREVAQAIVDATHGETCAYSNATRGNVEVTLTVYTR